MLKSSAPILAALATCVAVLSIVLGSGHQPVAAQKAPPTSSLLTGTPYRVPGVPPPNDYFSQSLTITTLPYTVTEQTADATTHVEDPVQTCTINGVSQNSHSVWFRYTATATGPLTAYTYGSDYDTVLSVHTGSWGALTMVACNDDVIPYMLVQSRVVFTPTLGTTYFLEITSWHLSPAGNLNFVLRPYMPPANDDFDAAEIVPGVPVTYTLDTFDATRAYDDPALPCHRPRPGMYDTSSVWYRYSPASRSEVGASTAGSNYDTVLAVWTGLRGSLVGVACNDDSAGGQSYLAFEALPGQTYYIEVVSKDGVPGGWLALDFSESWIRLLPIHFLNLLPPATPLPPPTSTPILPSPTPTGPPLPGSASISYIAFLGSGQGEPDEWVSVVNGGGQPMNLYGWTLRNNQGQTFTFPGYTIQPGQVCRVYTNEWHPEWCGFTYQSISAVWNNAGDCGHLLNAQGVEVSRYCY